MSDNTAGTDKPNAPEEPEQALRRLEDLPPAARRALAEAQERRAKNDAETQPKPREIGGRQGADPARYGDWEVKGIAVDF
ncbi:DUF1674 domain-containing protein [Oricola sp.]|uniref:DUF1674 domain-containing protein n=1 Tax=Oricola sp. TaxID=1979950 RepID=UPI003BAB8230